MTPAWYSVLYCVISQWQEPCSWR